MRRFSCLLVVAGSLSAAPARADIPTADAALLTEHAKTSATTVKLVPITTGRKDANDGVNCAVTTGKKAGVSDPTVAPQAGSGARTIQPYAPDLPSSPGPDARGPALGRQKLFGSAGDVIGGLDASRSTIDRAASAFRSAGQQVGTVPTVMGALDVNSAARLSNNLAWNGAINSANLWVTALNALNLARVGDASAAASGMRMTVTSSAPRISVPACPAGSLGSGTSADPCRAAAGICSTTLPSDPSCAVGRFTDESGTLMFAVLPSTRVSSGQTLTLADAIAALASSSSTPP